VAIPEDMPAGKYRISLVQDGLTWLLADTFEVYEVLVIKQFSSIRYYAPYIDEAQLVMEWKVSREEPVTFTVSQYILENGAEELNAYDHYVMDAAGLIILEHDGFESSNDLEVSYQRDADGQVTVADVLVYGDDDTTPFTWTYDAEGRLLDISSPKRSFRSLEYEGDNLTMFRQMTFEYDADSPANHPYAQDVIWGYMALQEENDPFVYFPYFMGWYTEASAQLPARIVKPSPTGTGTVTLTLSYEFDDDGYVSKMSWTDEGENYAVEYRY
jgi:YD repeat-containing protein